MRSMGIHRPNLHVRRKRLNDNHLIPLINIVFLLLIFFMVGGQIEVQDGLGIEPPDATVNNANLSPLVDIQVNKNSEWFLAGQPVAVNTLQEVLASERYANSTHLTIKADRTVLASELYAVLDIARLAGISTIRLVTNPSGD